MVYHLALDRKMTMGATLALLPGDPDRVPGLARSLDSQAKEMAWKREFRTWMARVKGTPILVTSTGIGGPSTSIAVDELAQVGVTTFLRVGTCGGIQRFLRVGDMVITTGAVRIDGASTHYAPLEYPAVADHGMVATLIRAAEDMKIPYHAGITASSDTFYPGEERTDSFSGYVPRRFRGALREWEKLHVLSFEMEAATLLTVCSVLGLKGGCVCGVVDLHRRGGKITSRALRLAESRLFSLASRTVSLLIT